ncbi:hypothetical protein DFH09DRAFT_1366833 [Mycena vulgaris]|nr:hypothetical protein DFH09DRAFT_1366833 [Mycena vulgaris]
MPMALHLERLWVLILPPYARYQDDRVTQTVTSRHSLTTIFCATLPLQPPHWRFRAHSRPAYIRRGRSSFGSLLRPWLRVAGSSLSSDLSLSCGGSYLCYAMGDTSVVSAFGLNRLLAKMYLMFPLPGCWRICAARSHLDARTCSFSQAPDVIGKYPDIDIARAGLTTSELSAPWRKVVTVSVHRVALFINLAALVTHSVCAAIARTLDLSPRITLLSFCHRNSMLRTFNLRFDFIPPLLKDWEFKAAGQVPVLAACFTPRSSI